MKIHYTIDINEQYCEASDEVMCDTVEFDYEPDYEELENAIHKIFAKYYGVSVEVAQRIIEDFDYDLDACEELFEDEIKEYFSKDAHEQFYSEN